MYCVCELLVLKFSIKKKFKSFEIILLLLHFKNYGIKKM